MCEPTFFDVEYAINPHMDPEVPVDKDLAMRQWETLKNVYEELGAEVITMPGVKGLPDMAFSANCGHPANGVFLRSNFRHEVRRPESRLAYNFFKGQGKVVFKLDESVFFEGQGDLIRFGDRYFLGHGFRSDKETASHLKQLVKEPISTLQLVNPKLYHLDTCFGPLNEDTVVVSRTAFTDQGIGSIVQYASDIIYTNEQDDSVLGCNLVAIGDTVVLGEGISDRLGKAIQKRGFDVRTVPMSEFLKSGGSVKCLTLEQY